MNNEEKVLHLFGIEANRKTYSIGEHFRNGVAGRGIFSIWQICINRNPLKGPFWIITSIQYGLFRDVVWCNFSGWILFCESVLEFSEDSVQTVGKISLSLVGKDTVTWTTRPLITRITRSYGVFINGRVVQVMVSLPTSDNEILPRVCVISPR